MKVSFRGIGVHWNLSPRSVSRLSGNSTDQIHTAAVTADLEDETQDDTRADLLLPQDLIKQSKMKGVLRRTVTRFGITAYVLRLVLLFVLRSNFDGLSRTRKKVSFAEPVPPAPPPQPTPPTTVNTTDNQIEDLCTALKKCSGERTKACMGILGDECNGWHRIWPPSTPTYSRFRNIVTLDILLQPGLISQRARLELGVQLATAVVLLHRSEWLSENWGKRDICFPQKAGLRYGEGGKRIDHLEPVIDQPFVRGNFETAQSLQTAALHSSHQNASQSFTTSALAPVEQSLFSLGIVLVELWFEHPIEELRIQHYQTNDFQITDSDNIDYQTAKQLIGELLASAGLEYGLAVSNCIDGLNSLQGLNPRIISESKSLNDCEYKDAVHTAVICRLEKNLKVGYFYTVSCFPLGLRVR